MHAYPDSAGRSTFGVFFSDVIRPFGSASVSRGVVIDIDRYGQVNLDRERAEVVKGAIARGLLKELSGIERNIYPKKDLEAIDQLLSRFGSPPK